jgi:transcriptional regulator with XRE-family HTH domain
LQNEVSGKNEKELNLVKKTCKELGITQKELAEMMGVSRQTVNNWANERAKTPKILEKLNYLLKIEEKYKCIQEKVIN